MANLQSQNALMIEQGIPQKDRLGILRNLAIRQLSSLIGNSAVKRIDQIAEGQDAKLLSDSRIQGDMQD